ncbi:MAG: hypothetical protein ACKO2F_06835 [Cyanobacteriota bacterium]
MYLLTIREGLATRYIGPYDSPKHAADDLDRQLAHCDERARWQIHELQSPLVSISGDGGRAVPAPAA